MQAIPGAAQNSCKFAKAPVNPKGIKPQAKGAGEGGRTREWEYNCIFSSNKNYFAPREGLFPCLPPLHSLITDCVFIAWELSFLQTEHQAGEKGPWELQNAPFWAKASLNFPVRNAPGVTGLEGRGSHLVQTSFATSQYYVHTHTYQSIPQRMPQTENKWMAGLVVCSTKSSSPKEA